MTRGAIAALLAVAALLPACETLAPAPRRRTHPPPTASVVALYQQPAERALIDGIRLYEEAAFERADQTLRAALRVASLMRAIVRPRTNTSPSSPAPLIASANANAISRARLPPIRALP